MPARTAAGRRRSVQSTPYSILCPSTANHSLLVGTAGVPAYAYERTQPFSLWFWANPRSVGANANFFCECGAASPFRGIIVRHASTALAFRLISGSGTGEASKNFPILPIGRWTHVVLTYDGSSSANGLKAYYNNVAQTGTISLNNLTGTIVEAGVTTRWGAFSNGSSGADAYMIPGGVVNYEMSTVQVADLFYDNNISGTAPIDRYPLTEGSGTTAASSGTGAHNITLVGVGTTWSSSVIPRTSRQVIAQNRIVLS